MWHAEAQVGDFGLKLLLRARCLLIYISCQFFFHENGPIKVNLEFSFSFAGFSFSGLDLTIYSGFKPEIHFICQFQFSQQLLIVSLCFSTRLSSQNLSFELFFSALWLSSLELWVSNSIFLGFQTQVFNFQFLTRPNILFSRFPNF